MMDDQAFVYGTAAVVGAMVAFGVLRRSFDPFAPIWLFLVGYFQVYVVQAISYRDYALRVRGVDLVTSANARALWALVWFLLVYHCGISRLIAARLPRPPARLSATLVCTITPGMILWGLFCAGVVAISGEGEPASAEEALFRSFPIMMLVAAVLLIVCGRSGPPHQRVLTWIGLGVAAVYTAIWILNGKRSPPLFGVLATICAVYASKGKRPSKAVPAGTALVGILIVSVAIGWRNTRQFERSPAGFLAFLAEFDLSTVLVNLNLKEQNEGDFLRAELASDIEEGRDVTRSFRRRPDSRMSGPYPNPIRYPMSAFPTLLVSLATYNEVDNLQPLIESIRDVAPESSILVIDDNSPDGTGRLAEELRARLPRIHVIHRPGKLGLGTAFLEAMRFAIENGFDYLLNLDADFSHPPRFIPALLSGMQDHDVMIGSRYVPGGGVEGEFGIKRKLMSAGINWYARLLLGLETRDNSGAFRCYRVSSLARIDLTRVRSRGYSFQEEILYRCRQVGCRIGETPILFENRRSGVSKLNKSEAVAALGIILRLGIERALGNRRGLEVPSDVRPR
jgi:dolichol-phosphate mannosyltransferase